MTTQELQNHIHVYSMFSFRDGKREPGICINKYNIPEGKLEYFFIPQNNMQLYKSAFLKFDKETCMKLSMPITCDDVINIRPVSLADYKMIMELILETKQQANSRN